MSGYKTRHGYAAEYLEARTDAQQITERCMHCRKWVFIGRADQARERFVAHCKAKHPETLKPKRRAKRIWRRAA